MECYFNMCDEKAIKDAVKFFKLIGMEYITYDVIDSAECIYIEFMDMPDILKTYCMKSTPAIYRISSLGISFYLAVINGVKGAGTLISERGNCDGIIFCPMTNIKVINSFGGLRYEDDEKKPRKKEFHRNLN